jgi:TonB family protein
MVWNQALVAEHVLHAPQKVVLGYGPDAIFPLPEGESADGNLTLLIPVPDGYSLQLPPNAQGAVWLAGQRRDVRQLLGTTPSIVLGADDFGVVSLGATSFFFQQVKPQPERAPKVWRLDGDLVSSFGLSVFVHACIALLLLLAEHELPTEQSLELPPELIARFLVSPPPDELVPEPVKSDGGREDPGLRSRDEAGGKRDKGDEGRVGKRDATTKDTTIAGKNDGPIAGKVRGMGVLGALAGGDSLREALDVQSVGSLLSGLDSATTMLGQGTGGKGLRGVGQGGGGDGPGNLFGGGALGTGVGSGNGSGGGRGAGGIGGRGTGQGSGRGEAKVAVTPGTPQVSGFLSAEQINRVVRANQAALRYCYESEAQHQRNLRGKVVIQWRVDRQGGVPSASVASSTLGDAHVEGCLVRQVRKWRFPQPDGGEVSVMYPFIFGIGG